MGKVILQWLMVHSFDKKLIEEAHDKAWKIFCMPDGANENPGPVFDVARTEINAYYWFIVGPSGSMLGWEEDDRHRNMLEELIAWMSAYRHVSYPGHAGYQPFNWTLVEHDDEIDPKQDGHAVVDDYVRHDRGAL